MSEDNTQTPANENAEAETHEQGSDDAAVAALIKNQLTEDAPEPDDEPKEEAEAEADEGEPDEAEPEEELVEVEAEGKTYKVAPEVQKAMLRQADYSRKMSAVQATEKVVAQQKETVDRLLEGAEKYAEALAEVKGIEARLKQFETVPWQKLRQENPAEYAALSADLNTLRLSREESARKAQGLDAELKTGKDKLFATKRAEMVTALQKDLKGWGDKLGTEVTQYAVEIGYALEDIAQTTDPKWVIAMNKAMKYDALQKGKADLKAKVRDVPPVLKPGAPRKADTKGDAMAQLRKTRSEGDAVAALLARQR